MSCWRASSLGLETKQTAMPFQTSAGSYRFGSERQPTRVWNDTASLCLGFLRESKKRLS